MAMSLADTIPLPSEIQSIAEPAVNSSDDAGSSIETLPPTKESVNMTPPVNISDGNQTGAVHTSAGVAATSGVNVSPSVSFATSGLSVTQSEDPADTVSAVPKEAKFGITLTPPVEPEPEWVVTDHTDISIVISCLLLLFCVIAFRFRDNRKYLVVMVRNLVDVRERQNVFDETVRETGFLLLLNLLWCFSTGIILYCLLTSGLIEGGGPLRILISGTGIAICTGVAVVYTLFMSVAYITVGSVFSNLSHARLWLKGYTASQAIMSFFYFPLALLFLCYPAWSIPLFWIAGIVFVVSKLAFITKGARIFFNQFSSWVLFLYYLCSLEIVPLILSYLAAVSLWDL